MLQTYRKALIYTCNSNNKQIAKQTQNPVHTIHRNRATSLSGLIDDDTLSTVLSLLLVLRKRLLFGELWLELRGRHVRMKVGDLWNLSKTVTQNRRNTASDNLRMNRICGLCSCSCNHRSRLNTALVKSSLKILRVHNKIDQDKRNNTKTKKSKKKRYSRIFYSQFHKIKQD